MATSLGVVLLRRQVLFDRQRGEHTLPGNAWLPSHTGMLVTRRLQEWACLLGSDFPFATAQRLLGWQTGAAAVLCPNEIRRLVCRHGQVLRAAAEAEVAELPARLEREELRPQLQPVAAPRRAAAWPAALDPEVAAALAAAESPPPPSDVAPAVWERVLAVRQAAPGERPPRQWARLGPEIRPGEVIAMADEVLVRQPEKRTFAELRTARVETPAGRRYLCGSGPLLLAQLALLLRLCGGPGTLVSLLGDGARWLSEFFAEQLAGLPQRELILDWYHLVKKCRDRISRMGGSRKEKRALLKALLRLLWEGKADAAVERLEGARSGVAHPKALDELIEYLRGHAAAIPSYRERWVQQRYIGSGPVEKANDLLVARRQKRQGMHWRLETSEALAWLRALRLNRDWDDYWQHGLLPSLVIG